MGISIIVTVVITVLVILAIQRRYQTGVQLDEQNMHEPRYQKNYRDQVFADIIKINSMTLGQGKLDGLTELPSREIFDARIKLIASHSRQYSQTFTVMILAIDNMQAINDAHGEVIGNQVLIEVTKRLQVTLRQIDTISRYAGNAFYLLLPDLSNADYVLHVSQRIQDALLEPIIIDQARIPIMFSNGAALCAPEDDTDVVIHHAKEALKNAKLIGENKYYIYKGEVSNHLQERTVAKFIAEHNISDNFMLYYQQYVDVSMNKIALLQAVSYLKHPILGMIGYNQFYHSLEIAGKLYEFAEWELKSAIAQIKKWKADGHGDQAVILKMSLRLLENRRHLQQIADILDNSGINNSLIVLEIEKGNVKTYQQSVNEVMEILESRHVKLLISLMELGRMNISNIGSMPFGYIKLDEELVKKLLGKSEDDLIIQALLTGIDKTSIILLADGVDLPEYRDKLINIGCTIMKGQVFLPAGPGEEVFVAHEYGE